MSRAAFKMEDDEDTTRKKWVKGKKRRQEDSDEDSSADSISEASDESFDESMEIPVEFEAFPPVEEDLSGIQCLLQQLFLKSAVDLSCLSDLIISQPEVSTVIKVATEEDHRSGSEDPGMGDEEDKTDCDVFGVTTVLNFTKYKENTAVKQLKKLLVDKCQECGNKDTQTQLIELVEKAQDTVGFLISERFINIPAQIAVPVYKTLRSELKKNHKKEKIMAPSYFIIVCKTYEDVETRNHKKTKKTKKQQSPTNQLDFINAEDELFFKESEFSFTYPASTSADETLVAGQWTSEDSELRPCRTVLVLSADKFERALESIYALFSQ